MPKARAGPRSPLLACCSCREEEVGVSTAGIPTPTLAVPRAGALILQHMVVLGHGIDLSWQVPIPRAALLSAGAV